MKKYPDFTGYLIHRITNTTLDLSNHETDTALYVTLPPLHLTNLFFSKLRVLIQNGIQRRL
jgi:hypothetical protein